DCSRASPAVCVPDCGDGLQWPKDRNPIFFMAHLAFAAADSGEPYLCGPGAAKKPVRRNGLARLSEQRPGEERLAPESTIPPSSLRAPEGLSLACLDRHFPQSFTSGLTSRRYPERI